MDFADQREHQQLIELADPGLQDLIGSIDVLPSPPTAVVSLNDALGRTEVVIEEVVSIIESDTAMTAKLLALVNSSFFGLSQRMTDVRQSVAYLGLDTVRNLLTAMELMRAFSAPTPELAQHMDNLHSHSMIVGNLARSLMARGPHMHESFAAGMMHDIGLLAVLSTLPDKFTELCNSDADEVEVLGTSHAWLGAYILDLWGVPQPLVQSVLHSHDAFTLLSPTLSTAHAVYVAEQLVNAADPFGAPWETGKLPSHEYLETVGLASAVNEFLQTSGAKSV